MESFFSNSEFVFEFLAENRKNIKRITRLGLCKRGGGGICADQHALVFFLTQLKKKEKRSKMLRFQIIENHKMYDVMRVVGLVVVVEEGVGVFTLLAVDVSFETDYSIKLIFSYDKCY